MKNRNLLSLYIFIFLLISGNLAAQDEKYDAIYEKLVKEYTLNDDGSMDFRYIKQQKLQTYRAFHNLYGETFIVFDTINQKLKFNEVYTIMADGKKVTAPKNAFNEVLPGFAANAPAYNNLREMVVTHTGLERNSTINLDYEVKSKKGTFPYLMGNEILAEAEPVKNLEIRVRVPLGTNLYYRMFNLDVKPVEVPDKKYQVFVWKFENVAAISAEEGQPEGYSQYPRLVFSNSGNISDAYSFLSSQPAFWFELPETAKAFVNRITNEEKDRFVVALKIQEKVAGDLRLYPIPFRTTNFRIRTAEESWNSNGATSAGKAVLLTAMLRLAGFDARVSGVVRSGFYDDKIATLSDLEDFVVWVDLKEKGEWYFSATSMNPANLKYTLSGRTFIVFGPDGNTMVKETAVPGHIIKVIGNFIVSSDPKLTGEVSLYFSGSAYPMAGLSLDKNKMRNTLSGNLIKNDSSSLKKNILNNDNGFQSYIVQSDKPFRKDSGFYFFQLPVVNAGIEGWNIRTLSEKREVAYEIPSLADDSYSYTFTMPSSLALFTPEKKQTISNKAGTYSWEVKNDKGKVTVKRSLKLNDQLIPLSVYPDFKILMDSWNNPWNRQLVFKKTE